MHQVCEGSEPYAGLVQANDNHIYGTTNNGGEYYSGTIFQLTLDGSLITLHSFSGSDGATPGAKLIQANDGRKDSGQGLDKMNFSSTLTT